MGLNEWIGRVAANAPVPLFAVAGVGAREAVQDLRLRPELRVLDAPAAASILLVAGAIPESLALPLARVHDALAHPRATVLWPVGGASAAASLPGIADPIIVEGDVAATAAAVFRDLVTGHRPSEPAILPDADPAPWRGIGPYGQGGSGMTGGVPYGRPMAELGPDPDGLRLDVLPVAVGPLFPRFPAGFVLDGRWAGDLILEATVSADSFDGVEIPVRPNLLPFIRALTEPVSIAELEVARAREHLRWLSDALLAHGLAALGERALRLAKRAGPGDGRRVRNLARSVSRSQVMRWSTRGVGGLRPEQVAFFGLGPVTRATGLAEDVRLLDPVYRGLGFEPLLGERGDAATRWSLRLAEAAQSLDLALQAGERRTAVTGQVESPRGRLEAGSAATDRLLPILPAVLRETEWGDAVATLVSLDLDIEEAALARRLTVAEAVA